MTEIEKIEVYKSTNNSSICKVCGKPRGNHRSSTLLCPLHPLDEYPRDYKWGLLIVFMMVNYQNFIIVK